MNLIIAPNQDKPRDSYHTGIDIGNGDSAAWRVMKCDPKTGILTVVECGIGDPPDSQINHLNRL